MASETEFSKYSTHFFDIAELIIEIFYRTLIIYSHHECYGDATEAVPGLCQQSADSSERIQQDADRQTDPGQSTQRE